MEATPNCHILLLFNAISMFNALSRSLFLVKHLDQFSMKQQYILGTVRVPMDRNHSAGKKGIELSLAVVVGLRAQIIVLTKPWIFRSLGQQLRNEFIVDFQHNFTFLTLQGIPRADDNTSS